MMTRIMIVLLIVLLTLPAAAQPADPAAPGGFSPELQAQMDTLVATTEATRGLPTLRPVERAFPTRAETIAYIADLYNAELPPADAARLVRFYAALGLLPADTDLLEVYIGLLGQQVAGFYDSDTGVMNVIPIVGDDVGDGLSLTEQIIFVHEYTHALQDQHFDLRAAMENEAVLASPDRSLAMLSLIEGDATAVMQVYAQAAIEANPLAAFALLAEGAQSGGLTLPPGIPDILATELLFPYEAGLQFVLALYRQGGWEAVDAAFANPPTTSEQIIDPTAYFAGEGAIDVTPPDYSPLFADDGWLLDWDTTVGQFYLREMLAAHLPAANAAAAAAGWGGDRFQLWTDPDTGDVAWVLHLRWDGFDEQAEFAAAFTEYLTARFGPMLTTAPGCWGSADETICWQGGESAGTVITAANTLELASALRDQP